MAGRLDTQRLGLVFQSRPDILEGIKSAADSPKRIALFNDIATFVHDLQNGPEPAAKRRRVDDGPATNGAGPQGANGTDPSQEEVLLEVKEISVSVPQRKKFELCFTPRHLYARAPGTTAPAAGIVYAWEDIEYVFYLPVPEKAQVQHNYVLFPRGSSLSALKTSTDAPEPLVFTVPAAAPKQGTIGGSHASQAGPHSDAYHTLLHWALRTRLAAASNPVDITTSDPNKFHSAIPQSHRPKEKAVHVKGFRGSKDGYLFFLPNGILWGFKKPLLFIPLDRVAAVSYTSVLQRTFNMVVEVFVGDGEATEEVEFGMIDQADYEGIDESYVKRNRLQDRSMADARKAKLELAENMKGVKKEGEGEGEEEDAGQRVSELEAAQAEDEQRLQDEEDELEEDYDPGSDGDSDGSGSSSEEDSDEEGGEYDEDEEGEDEGEEEEEEEGEGEGEGEEEEDEEMEGTKVEEEEPKPKVKREPSVGVTQASLAADDDELAGVPPGGDDDMDLEEKFDVVG